jgi:hypothetical protein
MPEKKDFTEADETPEAEKKQKIRELNDTLRQTFRGGRVIMTQGVNALDDGIKFGIYSLIRTFNKFTPDNDPHKEHDFGKVELAGIKCFWKIDYYDKTMTMHSPDSSDPEVTERVMTIMLTEEY